jgi:hypothetical protein
MSASEINMSDEPPDEVPLELAPRPAPSPAEVMAASTTSTGHWPARTLAQWGVPWPPPKGWREELRRLHAIGAEVTPLPFDDRKGRQQTLQRPSTRALPPQYRDASGRLWYPIMSDYVRDIGEPDPDDPPPWL